MAAEFDRVYDKRLCRIIATGSGKRAVLIEREDGQRLIARKRRVRKVRPSKN